MRFFPSRPARLVAAAVSIGAIVLGCESGTGVDPSVAAAVGNYVLRTVNDSVLPYTVETSTTARTDIVADTLSIGANGAFLDKTFFRHVTTGFQDVFDYQALDGVVNVSGTSVNFVVDGAVAVSGTISGNKLILSGNGNVSVYTR